MKTLILAIAIAIPALGVTTTVVNSKPQDPCLIGAQASGLGTTQYSLVSWADYPGFIIDNNSCNLEAHDVITTDLTGPGSLRIFFQPDLSQLAKPQYSVDGFVPRQGCLQLSPVPCDVVLPYDLGTPIKATIYGFAIRTLSGITYGTYGTLTLNAYRFDSFGGRQDARFLDISDSNVPEPSNLLVSASALVTLALWRRSRVSSPLRK